MSNRENTQGFLNNVCDSIRNKLNGSYSFCCAQRPESPPRVSFKSGEGNPMDGEIKLDLDELLTISEDCFDEISGPTASSENIEADLQIKKFTSERLIRENNQPLSWEENQFNEEADEQLMGRSGSNPGKLGLFSDSARSIPLKRGITKKEQPWTRRDDELLLQMIEKYEGKHWKEIAKTFPGRTAPECNKRWKVLRPINKRKPWDHEEDALLLSLVRQYDHDWAAISSKMSGRSGKQIRERFLGTLNPAINRKKWTKEEDQIILTMYYQNGSRWREISRALENRPENMVKNRFYSHIKKKMMIQNDGNSGPDEEETSESGSGFGIQLPQNKAPKDLQKSGRAGLNQSKEIISDKTSLQFSESIEKEYKKPEKEFEATNETANGVNGSPTHSFSLQIQELMSPQNFNFRMDLESFSSFGGFDELGCFSPEAKLGLNTPIGARMFCMKEQTQRYEENTPMGGMEEEKTIQTPCSNRGGQNSSRAINPQSCMVEEHQSSEQIRVQSVIREVDEKLKQAYSILSSLVSNGTAFDLPLNIVNLKTTINALEEMKKTIEARNI